MASGSIDRKAGDNMNGDYTIANGVPGATKAFSTRNADYDGGVEYFDVYSPVITSRYSEVYWTMMEAVPLPQDIIDRFEGKVMAITGHEADQVFKSTTPGVPDVSVPITWAYNHHYGHYINGKNSVLEETTLSAYGAPEDTFGHATPGESVWITRARHNDSNPTSTIPTSTVFATGNGGEFRKSFHSYPAPYAQLLESPSSWSIIPMQIDTRNRNGSMAKPGMPFVPGPYPANANAPRSGPDAVYSGLLECPCTDRITRHLGTAQNGSPVPKIDGTACTQELSTVSGCKSAAASLAAEAAIPAAPSPPPPPGACAAMYSEHGRTFLGGYAAGSPPAGWLTLAEAQGWCCANAARCGGVTFQTDGGGVHPYTARAPGKLQNNSDPGLDTWVLNAGRKAFNFTTGASAKQPAGCSITVSSAGVTGYYNTVPSSPVVCGGAPGNRHVAGAGGTGGVLLTLQLSEASNTVTIVLVGPSDVWFGVGFNAQAMGDLPWTIVVDGGTGKVSERKLADQAPGILLQPSVVVVNSSVSNSRRTVVITRSIKMNDYEGNYFNFDLTTASFPFITAVGAGATFAYHKSHAVGKLAMFAEGGAATCICAGAPPPFGKTSGGTIAYDAAGTPEGTSGSVGFGKNCVGSCDAAHTAGCTQNSTLIETKNPTCDVRTYRGGLSCCHHHYFLLDKNQSIPAETMSYQMKARFYFQEYQPQRHEQLYRWHWQTADGAGEYDIPKCAEGTPPDECVHTLKARIRVSDFASGPCDPRSGLNALTPACKKGSVGFKPIFLDGHCHAPTCLSMEMFNDDTGESICRTVPTYGTMRSNTTGNNTRFEELGYLALPPCIWSETGSDGLPEPPLLTWDANVSAVKRCNSTYYHTGEMARWQGHGVIV